MVKYQQNTSIARILGALADPTRLSIIERLSQGPTRVSHLAAPFAMSAPAISKHLRVLETAGLIRRVVRGRHHWIHLDPERLSGVASWLKPVLADALMLQPSVSQRIVFDRTKVAPPSDLRSNLGTDRSLKNLLLRSRLEKKRQAHRN